MTFKLTRIACFGILLFLASCSPAVYTRIAQPHPALQSNEEVRLIGLNEKVPDSAVVIGAVKVGDSGFTTDCSWNTVVERARMEARKAGGNGIKITSHLLPTALGSTCHRITADILKLKSVTATTSTELPPAGIAPETPSVTRVIPADSTPVYTAQPAPLRNPSDKKSLLSPSKRFRIDVQGGFSYVTASTSSSAPAFLKSYLEELKSGAHWSASLAVFLNENLGLGMRYSGFYTSNVFNGQVYVTNTVTKQTRIGGLSDDITINFIGPEFSIRSYTANNKFCFLFGLAVGYLDYKNNSMVIDEYTFTGNTVGYGIRAGIDYVFDKNIGIGIAVSTCNGSLSSMVRDDGTIKEKLVFRTGEYENVSRIDVSGGLRFYF